MTHASPEMQAYYAARATYYDAVYLKPERQADIAFLKEHLPDRLAGRHVLEVACGTGYWTQHIAPRAAAMVATDGTAQPLDCAQQRPGVGNVTFRQVDAYVLGDNLGTFDAAFAGLWFSHVPVQARTAFLQGLHARLAPGARVLFIDNNEVQCRDFPITERDEAGNTYQHRQLRDGSVHRVLKNVPSEQALQELLASCACRLHWRNLQDFWLLEYELAA